jgi:hypothetical protein
MGREEIFHTFFLLLVEIEEHFTHELVSYVYETQDSSQWKLRQIHRTPLCQLIFCKTNFITNTEPNRWIKITLFHFLVVVFKNISLITI